MACTVTKKDIQRDIKNKFLDLDGVRPTPSGVFEDFSTNNPDSMSTKFRDKIKELREVYQEDTYGKILSVTTEQYGTMVTINPSQALADAMTAQNEADEKITQRAEASNIQRADAQRAGIQYEDGYLFDSRRNENPTFYQLPQDREQEEFVASEKTIRDLATRMSDRIGIPVRFESDRTKEYKGKLEHGTAVVNLAYATLDTPIHEILGHPIIRAIKNGTELSNFKYEIKELNDPNAPGKFQVETFSDENLGDVDFFDTEQDAKEYVKSLKLSEPKTQLYQNLLKELEYGKGKEVLDRIKRDYVNKPPTKLLSVDWIDLADSIEEANEKYEQLKKEYFTNPDKYTLEEQQEEAIVELLGLMTAEKLDNVKDGKLISLLKRLLKEMKAFMKQLLGQKEVEIDKLPDNMTLGDIANLLAYSNSRLILPGNEVVYTTPDNQQFKTYQEASKHISDLAKSVENVDLSNLSIRFATKIEDVPNKFSGYAVTDNLSGDGYEVDIFKNSEGIFKQIHPYTGEELNITNEQVLLYYNGLVGIKSFIEKNKEYEQSKEIIEEWKKVNNIQYNPEEVYSRGQEFVSVVGAYSNFDVNLMMQNLLQHIEDNQKAGGEFTISAFTKPVDRKIGHLEGGGGKIKFKIYPQSQDIKWAANTDVYSGSVWDASKKVSKDKKSELLGVSYTKYPSLQNVNKVQPNLASIIDDLSHHHNELGISLTGSNFRLEYDEDIPYSTKKIIDSINSILDQKYGKLATPKVENNKTLSEYEAFKNIENKLPNFFDTGYSKYKKENGKWYKLTTIDEFNEKSFSEIELTEDSYYNLTNLLKAAKEHLGIIPPKYKNEIIQPTQTNETLKENIESVSEKIGKDVYHIQLNSYLGKYVIYGSMGVRAFNENFNSEKEAQDFLDKKYPKKEYTSQALINTKIAKLKEVAKKYPRSLIRSEVRSINSSSNYSSSNLGFDEDELPFQKVNVNPSNNIQPQGNNYVEFVRYKKERLESINNELGRLNFTLKNTNLGSNIDVVDINNRIKALEKESSIISRQLEALAKDESEYMFHAIEEDLNNLEKVLDSNSIFDINKVNSRLDFLDEFISGTNKEYKGESLAEYNNPAFNVIAGKIKELQVKATQRIMEVSRNSIENSSLVQNLINENPELDVKDLFQAQKDLNWLETWTLGVTADRTNNTVIPQALYTLLRNTLTRKQSTVESWNKQLKALVDANPELKNPDFIKEKDSSGNETGFIVNLFSPTYYKTMVKYKKLLDNFIGDSNQENYNKVVTELLQHNNIIDFTRIQAVKNLYEGTYPDYFTSSEEDMDKYEESLRKGLGPKYDEVINQILNRLALFEEKKIDALSEGGQYVSRDLASQDIWKFNEIMKSPNKYSKVAYSHENQIYGVLFKDFNNVTFLPKETTSKEVMTDEGPILLKENTGYYNEAFKDIANSPSKLEYWNLIKNMSEYISSTYDAQTYGRLSYPKIQKEYAERLQEGLKDKNIGSIIAGSAKEYKSWFYERGRHKDGKTIAPNYVESFESDVKKLAQTYVLQGIDKEDAYIRARKEILDTYSDDFNSNMVAVAMEAALHDARLEVQPMSEAYIKYFKSIGPERENAIKKLEHFYEKIILNTNEKYRDSGKTEGKGLSEGTWLNRMLALMQKVPYLNRIINEKSTYLLSDAEAKIFEQLKLIQKEGGTSADYSFSLDGIVYIQKKGRTYESIGEENVHEISQEYFQENFELHIQEEINKLGLDLNLAGGINGILKTVIFKGLALNPISGIFNRIEGKHSAMIMDATGEYWTTGNIDVANNLMSFANITRLSKGRLSPVMAKRKETLQIFDTLMKQFNILQDRKNELQRSAEEAKFNRELLNPYMFAVENPEYKNQGSIIMAVLMDKKVTDVNGNVVPLLNKETGEFSIFNTNNGKLELKPEFQTQENIEAFQNFRGTNIQNLVLKMTDAVSRSQGNYDSLDIMMVKKSIWGRAATVFMTWFAEHINQRFGVSGDKNYNLNTGKKRRHGRFIEAYRSNKLNTMIGAVTGLTVSYGIGGPLLLAMGVGGLGFMVYKKFVGNIAGPKAIKRDINYAMELLEFTKSLMVESLNYPGRILNVNSKLKINNNSFEGTNMSKDEIAAMRALTRELAIVLTWLGVKLAMGALMYDDEDDKESPQRMKHNFIQNQLSRAINALTIYSNPQELVSDHSRMAALETLSSAGKVLMAAFNEKQREDLGKNFLDLTPVPRILTKNRMPYHDKMNYDEMSNFSGIPSPMKWTSEFFKNYSAGPERQAEKDYRKILKELREDLKEEYMSKHKGKKAPLKDELDALIKEKIGGYKKKEQTYQEKLKQVESLDLD